MNDRIGHWQKFKLKHCRIQLLPNRILPVPEYIVDEIMAKLQTLLD